MTAHDPESVEDAIEFLKSIGSHPRLQRHGQIVAEVAKLLSEALTRLGITHDSQLVVIGAALHDAGKIVHPEELYGPGREHESAGERLLMDHGISAKLAQVCRTHGSRVVEDITLEERLIALADYIWKGTRDELIEGFVIEEAAKRLKVDRWEVFLQLDPIFEEIASQGTQRLIRARE